MRIQELLEFKAYHGSSREFNEFSLEKALSGEGNMSFGYGVYIAGNPETGKHYALVAHEANKARIFDKTSKVNALQAKLRADMAVRRGQPNLTPQQKTEIHQEIQQLQKEVNEFNKGLDKRLYELEVNDSITPFLFDLDIPGTKQTPQVQKILQQVENININDKGIKILKELEEPLGVQGATQALEKLGIKGTKYLDAGSRVAGGTYNYVIFNPANIKIINKKII